MAGPWKFFDPAIDTMLRCPCGCGRMEMDDEFMRMQDEIRLEVGVPLIVLSGFRCPEYNDEISTTGLKGPHTTGRAIDYKVDSRLRWGVLDAAALRGCSRFGIGNGSIHVDDLEESDGFDSQVIWAYY